MSDRPPRADAGPTSTPSGTRSDTRAAATECRPLRKDAERNRRRILDAALVVFADQGFAATLDDVAHAAGLGVGTVYRRFPDKDALVEALFEERITGLVELAEQFGAVDDPWTGLVGFLEAASQRMAEDRGLRQAVLTPHHGRGGVAVARGQLIPRVEGLLERARRSGQLRPDVASSDLVTALEAVQVAAEIGGSTHPEHWRRLFVVLLDGLRADGRHAPFGACPPLPGGPLTEDELAAGMALRKHGRRA